MPSRPVRFTARSPIHPARCCPAPQSAFPVGRCCSPSSPRRARAAPTASRSYWSANTTSSSTSPASRSIVNNKIYVGINFNAQVNATLEVSTVQETVTVTSEAPIVDTKQDGTGTSFSKEFLQDIPSGRDPWVMLQRTAGIAMDRENIGGSQSGQQSSYISRGATNTNNKWMVDGVDVTDQAATGSSPVYFDFDTFEEMQVSTGGVDATQQTGGVGINIVTKSGTDVFRGSARYFMDRRQVRGQQRVRRAAPAGRGRRQRRFRTSRISASRGAGPSGAAARGSGAPTASRTSRSASSASTRPIPAASRAPDSTRRSISRWTNSATVWTPT